jgi:hypothetical protein
VSLKSGYTEWEAGLISMNHCFEGFHSGMGFAMWSATTTFPRDSGKVETRARVKGPLKDCGQRPSYGTKLHRRKHLLSTWSRSSFLLGYVGRGTATILMRCIFVPQYSNLSCVPRRHSTRVQELPKWWCFRFDTRLSLSSPQSSD